MYLRRVSEPVSGSQVGPDGIYWVKHAANIKKSLLLAGFFQ